MRRSGQLTLMQDGGICGWGWLRKLLNAIDPALVGEDVGHNKCDVNYCLDFCPHNWDRYEP